LAEFIEITMKYIKYVAKKAINRIYLADIRGIFDIKYTPLNVSVTNRYHNVNVQWRIL